MRVIVLQSGSNGNCTYVESNGTRLLFDAGISGAQLQRRLTSLGRDANSVDALLVSHDHSDHVRSMGIFHRKFDIPVHLTRPTFEAATARKRLGRISEPQFFSSGERLGFPNVHVETIQTPHDGVDGVGFVVDDGQRRLGILTDLGHAFKGLKDVLGSLDAVLLESNYDPHMLETGPYPEFLKRRIRGQGGHLSNDESAQLLTEMGGNRLQWACLGHLSEHNNAPALALQTHRKHLGNSVKLHVASRYDVTGELTVV